MKVTIEGDDVLVVLSLLRESIVTNSRALHERYHSNYDSDAEYEIAHMSDIATIGAMCGVYTKMFTNMQYPEDKQ
jgi:hypothetical protein